MTAPAITIEQERERLMSFTVAELKIIAEEMNAPTAKTKVQLVENILAKRSGEQAEVLPEEADAIANPELAEVPEAESEPEVDDQVADELPDLPIKHLMLTMFNRIDESTGILNDAGVNRRVEQWFAKGYDPIEFQPIGFGPNGHRLFWVLQKVEQPKYTRALHIMRLLTPQPDPQRDTISGQMADAYISAFIEQGWTLMAAKSNGMDMSGEGATGLYVIWMLVK
jgi:hypothetical protein